MPEHSRPPTLVSNAVQKPAVKVLLAAPRGFCAGVDRAIQIVELALAKFGAPVYVRHEIVHNRFVVDSLKAKGAIFVDELDQIPDTTQPVIFSAHGVAKAIPEAARLRNLFHIDATCPLVSKVHIEAARESLSLTDAKEKNLCPLTPIHPPMAPKHLKNHPSRCCWQHRAVFVRVSIGPFKSLNWLSLNSGLPSTCGTRLSTTGMWLIL